MFLSNACRKRIFRLVSLRDQKKTLINAINDVSTQKFLVPPFVAPYELRTIFKVDYASIFKVLNIKYFHKRYVWKDEHERTFDSVNKRNVHISFPLLAPAASLFNVHPVLVDPEPVWDYIPTSIQSVPVFVVLGHTDHGKTTLIDTLAGTSFKQTEHGGITQNLRAQTLCLGSPSDGSRDIQNSEDNTLKSKYTLIDTPGQGIFDIMRGRAASLCDAALLIVDMTQIDSEVTKESFIHASKNNLPTLVVLTKSDLPFANTELAKLRLNRLASNLYDLGLASQNFKDSVSNAIPVSCVSGDGLNDLTQAMAQLIQEQISDLKTRPRIKHLSRTPHLFPRENVISIDSVSKNAVPGIASWYPPLNTDGSVSAESAISLIRRRVEALQDFELNQPTGVGIIIDTEMTHSPRGRTIHVLMRQGSVVQGQYFLAGTHWGRVRQMWTSETLYASQAEAAGPGIAIQVSGLDFEGEVAPDDIFIVLPRVQAWRLALYRRMVEKVRSLQTSGPMMDVQWQSDPPQQNPRTQVSGMYESDERPMRMRTQIEGEKRTRMEEITNRENQENGLFKKASTADWEANFGGGSHSRHRKKKASMKYKGGLHVESDDEQSDTEEDEEVEMDRILLKDGSVATGGENSKKSSILMNELEEEDFTDQLATLKIRISQLDQMRDKAQSEYSNNEDEDVYDHIRKQSSQVESIIDDFDPVAMMESENVHTTHQPPQKLSRRDQRRQKRNVDAPQNEGLAIQDKSEMHDNDSEFEEPFIEKTSSGMNATTKTKTQWIGAADISEHPTLLLEKKTEATNARWNERSENRRRRAAEERDHKADLVVEAEKIRRVALGMAEMTLEEETAFKQSVLLEDDIKASRLVKPINDDDDLDEDGELKTMPGKGTPVIPIILRVAFQQSFTVILDALEDLQLETGCRLPVVYGGVGAVRPTDVSHALIEQHYSYCPIYAYQVPVLPQARQLAETQEVELKNFKVYTDLLDDVRMRCNHINKIRERTQRTEKLRLNSVTKSGL